MPSASLPQPLALQPSSRTGSCRWGLRDVGCLPGGAGHCPAHPPPAVGLRVSGAQAPLQHKLPVFYLLDSIAKNVGEPYKAYFAGNLADVRREGWLAAGACQPPTF